jgi:hypothetical protein
MNGNTFYTFSAGSVNPADHPNNTYLTSRPTGMKVFIRPNAYEAGRGHIVVYNWDLAPTVGVNLSGLLSVGDSYEVRNGQNYLAAPVASGVYNGGTVTLPLGDLTPAQPTPYGMIAPSEYTGKEFNVFVVLKTGGSTTPTPIPSATPTATPTPESTVFPPPPPFANKTFLPSLMQDLP